MLQPKCGIEQLVARIGHGFDDQGSAISDGDGVMRNWWTLERPSGLSNKKTGALVAQYSAFKVFPDLTVNGESFTQGEKILRSLVGFIYWPLERLSKMSLKGKESPVLDGFTGRNKRIFLLGNKFG
jgi:putative endopeptidase